jgi:hypothetical protein
MPRLAKLSCCDVSKAVIAAMHQDFSAGSNLSGYLRRFCALLRVPFETGFINTGAAG